MLEPVALHQTGFKVPGLAQDRRGVVVGTHAAVLLLAADRLVALLRLWSEELQLDDVLPSLRIEQVRNPLGAQAYLLTLQCADSLLLDRLARPARLTGAVLCVGAGKHFVPYRDRRAPLGYDARELAPVPAANADYVLYTEAAAQPFVRVRVVGLLPLLGQLSLLPVPGGAPGALRALVGGRGPDGSWGPGAAKMADGAADGAAGGGSLVEPLWLTVPLALLGRIARYLWQRGAQAELATPDALPPPGSAAAAELPDEELALLRITQARGVLLDRLLGVPGLRLYQPVGEQLAIELGYVHPLRLASLGSLFTAGRMYLFGATRRGFTALPVGRMLPIARLIELQRPTAIAGGLLGEPFERATADAVPGRGQGPGQGEGEPLRPRAVASADRAVAPPWVPLVMRVPLKLVAERGGLGQRTPTATLIAWPRVLWLSRLLYALPAALLGGLQAACLDEGVLVCGAAGVHALPLGTLLYEPTPHVFIPLGSEFLPRLPGELLAAQLGGVNNRCIVFLPGQAQPLALAWSQLQPLTQQLLAPNLPALRSAMTVAEPPAPEVQNTPISLLKVSLFPLWDRLGDDEL